MTMTRFRDKMHYSQKGGLKLDKLFQDLEIGTFFLMNLPKESRENLQEWEAATSALHKKVKKDAAVRFTDGNYYAIAPGRSVRVVRL